MVRKNGRRHRKTAPHHSRSWIWTFTAAGCVLALTIGVIAMSLLGVEIPSAITSLIAPHDRTATSWQAVVTDDAVNVRTAASTDSDVIGSAMAQQRVTVTGGPVGDFLPVVMDGKQGWMATDYLRRDLAPFVSVASAASANDSALSGSDALAVGSGPTAISGLPVQAETTDLPVGDHPTEAPPKPMDETAPAEPEMLLPEPTLPPKQDQQSEDAAAPDIPSDVGEGEHWIHVDRTTAMITLYIGDQPQSSLKGKIGRDPSVDGFYSTAVGTFHVYSMQRGLSGTPFVEDVYLSDWVGFDPVRKNGFHSPVREADGTERVTQNPTTMGCVRLTAENAVLLFNFADLGMRVEIHD
ncbi:MAG: L,D-transpeptidase family protein [Thermomicrobiales bacterium]